MLQRCPERQLRQRPLLLDVRPAPGRMPPMFRPKRAVEGHTDSHLHRMGAGRRDSTSAILLTACAGNWGSALVLHCEGRAEPLLGKCAAPPLCLDAGVVFWRRRMGGRSKSGDNCAGIIVCAQVALPAQQRIRMRCFESGRESGPSASQTVAYSGMPGSHVIGQVVSVYVDIGRYKHSLAPWHSEPAWHFSHNYKHTPMLVHVTLPIYPVACAACAKALLNRSRCCTSADLQLMVAHVCLTLSCDGCGHFVWWPWTSCGVGA